MRLSDHTHKETCCTRSQAHQKDLKDTKMQLLHIVYKVYIPLVQQKDTVCDLVYFLQTDWARCACQNNSPSENNLTTTRLKC